MPDLLRRAWVARLVLVVPLAGCGSDDGAPKRWVVGASIDRLSNDYFVKIKEGIEARCDELGVECTVLDAKGDDAVQLQQLETFVRQKVDGIIVAAVNDDVPALEEIVRRARAQGIKVVAQSQRVRTADVYVSIRQRDYGRAGGELAGAWIREHGKAAARVGVVGMPERATILERVEGLKEGVLKLAPDARVEANIAAPTPEKARSNTEAALQQDPELRVIVAFNDDSGLAAAAAIKARFGARAAKAAHEFAVFGLDAIPGAVAAIQDPESPYRGTVDIDPFGNGKVDVDAMVALLEGREVAGAQRTAGDPTAGGTGDPGQLYLPVAMKGITEKNVAALGSKVMDSK